MVVSRNISPKHHRSSDLFPTRKRFFFSLSFFGRCCCCKIEEQRGGGARFFKIMKHVHFAPGFFQITHLCHQDFLVILLKQGTNKIKTQEETDSEIVQIDHVSRRSSRCIRATFLHNIKYKSSSIAWSLSTSVMHDF